jgi:flavin-dependent dehydrogenase
VSDLRGTFDVVILGGGPSGSMAALSLASEGVSVALVERSAYADERIGETFPPAIHRVLARAGLWESFLAQRPLPSPGIRSVWGSHDAVDRSFMFDPYGSGWHVDRRAFDTFLAAAAEQRGVTLMRAARIDRVQRLSGGGRWSVTIASSRQSMDVTARFVVDATGRAAALGRRLGARRVSHDRLIGVYAFAQSSTAREDAVTLIEAAEHGWWYSAPIPSGRFVFAYMTDADLCEHDDLASVSAWRAQLEDAPHTRDRAAGLAFDATVHVRPANSSQLEPLCGDGWLAVGDAALAFDPLAGQGAYRALLSGMSAGAALRPSRDQDAVAEYAAAAQRDFDRYLVLRREHYGRETRWPNSAFWKRRSGGSTGNPWRDPLERQSSRFTGESP